jgi:hypothetical protein
MDPPKLPQELNQIVDFLAYKARSYGGKLQPGELQRFKSDLIEVPRRWTVAKASARSFERQCLEGGPIVSRHRCFSRTPATRSTRRTYAGQQQIRPGPPVQLGARLDAA